jgi:hypothetical protein
MTRQDIENQLIEYVALKEEKAIPIHTLELGTAIDFIEDLLRKKATDVNYNGIVLCKQKGCPQEALDYSNYCDNCYGEKYPSRVF